MNTRSHFLLDTLIDEEDVAISKKELTEEELKENKRLKTMEPQICLQPQSEILPPIQEQNFWFASRNNTDSITQIPQLPSLSRGSSFHNPIVLNSANLSPSTLYASRPIYIRKANGVEMHHILEPINFVPGEYFKGSQDFILEQEEVTLGGSAGESRSDDHSEHEDSDEDIHSEIVKAVSFTVKSASQRRGSRNVNTKPRMLPTKAVAILKKWYDDHQEYPYPSHEEKHDLVEKSGLTVSQVCNWFVNRRCRSKPRQ
jgi:hypothetical protein